MDIFNSFFCLFIFEWGHEGRGDKNKERNKKIEVVVTNGMEVKYTGFHYKRNYEVITQKYENKSSRCI